jgi:Zn-dependent membrane protease YugP
MTLLLVLLFVAFAPMLWLRYIFHKHDRVMENMPFDGREFGELILNEAGIRDVEIIKTPIFDHYNVREKKVSVLQRRLTRRSLTSLTIVCHEIGHAMQHHERYKPLEYRTRVIELAGLCGKILGGISLVAMPFFISTGGVAFLKLGATVLAAIIGIGLVIHVMTIGVELDASFNRAMPIIRKKIPADYHSACRSILLAAALTYVAGVAANLLSMRFFWIFFSRLT